MKTVLLILFLMVSVFGYSQEQKFEYCQIQVFQKLSGKTKILLDAGQGFRTMTPTRDRLIKDMTVKIETFNSAVDGINFMVSQGYEYVESYTLQVDIGLNNLVTHLYFIFRKPLEVETVTNVTEIK